MPMIKCPECGKEISDLAINCPNCGFPLGYESSSMRTSNNDKRIDDTSINNIQNRDIPLEPNRNTKKKEHVCGIIGLIIAIIALFSTNIILAIASIVLCAIAIKKKDFKNLCGKIGLGIGIFSFLISMLTPTYLKYVDEAREINSSESETVNEILEEQSTKQTQKENTQEKTEEPKERKEEIESLTVGSSFEKNGLKITINEADTDFRDYDNEYGWNTPDSGMKYIMVSFTFENNGNSDAYVSIYDFDCYADNTTCDQVYSLDDSNFMNTNLSPGRNVSFKTYYSVPTGAQSIELEYETNFWTNEKAIIKIQ